MNLKQNITYELLLNRTTILKIQLILYYIN